MPTERTLCVFGEVLFDRFEDGRAVLGGAPFNLAWHLAAFGAQPAFVSRVGDDDLGREIRMRMREWGLDDTGLQVDPDRATGVVDVRIVDGQPQYEIVGDRAWDAIHARGLAATAADAILYHGTLALRDVGNRAALAALAANGPGRFVDVNLRAPWWTGESVHAALHAARWGKLNEDELALLAPDHDGTARRARHLIERHGLERLYLTQGERGAVAFSAGGDSVGIAPASTGAVVDTVGAGDAFAAVLLLGLARDWPLERTLERAQGFASAVVGLRGATTIERRFYQPFLEAWGDS